MDLLNKKQPKVAIIITTFNQEDLLKKCLKSLKNKTNYKNYGVYVVDDSGNGEIGDKIKKELKWTKIIINKKNLGCSKSFNIGAKFSLKNYSPDYILWLNDDCEVIEKNWLKKMVKIGEGDKKIGIIGCKIIYPDGSLQSVGGYIQGWEITKISNFKKENIIDVDHIMGAVMLIKKDVINKIGLLDEGFTPYLLEDTDYCLRAKEKGFRIKSISSVRMIHKKGKTIDSLKNKRSLLIRFKNDIKFSNKHLNFKNRLFRIFIYLPLVAIFKKKRDIDELKLKNLRLRKDFPINLFFWILAFMPKIYKKVT